MIGARTTRQASAFHAKGRQSHGMLMRHPCFTLKRPMVFQVRKSLVEYVDEDLLKMDTSVFYQRVFILAKNVEPKRESAMQPLGGVAESAHSKADEDAAHAAESVHDEDQHYSEVATPDLHKDSEIPARTRQSVKIKDEADIDGETLTHTFRFDAVDGSEGEEESEHADAVPIVPEQPKDIFNYFMEMIQELHANCRELVYSPDPMCGLVIYMNEYTIMMLESCEDMIGIFCKKLLDYIPEYWQNHRVFHIEDHIKQLYTRQLIFRRIPAAFLNEKFPPSTPTDEYLMGKQHLIIKDKLFTICSLISESMDPVKSESSHQDPSMQPEETELDEEEGEDEEQKSHQRNHPLSQMQRLTVAVSETLPTEIFRKWLPEMQRIELVLSSTRFYYTLEEFGALYGNLPFKRDDDSFFWPIQNNYTPGQIYRRTPFDINLTFAEYAEEMNRRLQEEQEKHKAELEAAAAAEASAAAAAQPQAKSQKPKAEEEEPND